MDKAFLGNTKLHFIGVGGIGMSAITHVMHSLGFYVQGSDQNESFTTQQLKAIGIKVFKGHKASQIKDCDYVVISTAIRIDNPEYLEAKRLGIPIIRRAEVLAQIMRFKSAVAVAGTHGKTTTTTMVGHLFDCAKLDPTIINGGIINTYNSNARIGKSDWCIVEADESDGTFTLLYPTIGIVTNIEAEHLDHYGDFDSIKKGFKDFLDRIPFYGVAILCADDPRVMALQNTLETVNTLTYGFSEHAQIRATNIRAEITGTVFDVVFPNAQKITDLKLPIPGSYNVQNALAMITMAYYLDLDQDVIRKALSTYCGVQRRFTEVGHVNGIRIIDDYAHHPTEIRSVIGAAKQVCQGRLIVVAQPHRYSRLQSLFNDFAKSFEGADILIPTPVHAAGEAPLEGVSHVSLADKVKNVEKIHVVDTKQELQDYIKDIAQPNDMVLCLGAGSITQWAKDLAESLKEEGPFNGSTFKISA